MQPARHLVAALAELAAGVQDRHHDLDRRQLLLRVHVDRDPAAVVLDAHRAVLEQDDRDVVRVARQRFVDGVVDRFVDQLVEPALGGVADVHAGALANRLEAFENLDLVARVVVHSAYVFAARHVFT